MRNIGSTTCGTDNNANAVKSRIDALTSQLSTSQLKALLCHAESLNNYNTGSENLESLSSREREVLLLVSNGYSRREIGEALGITANTAAKHISNIYQKLGVTTVAEATRYVLANQSISI